MRKIMLLAAILATLEMGSQSAQARDQGAGGRHFSAHAGVKFHRPHYGFKHHRHGYFGKPRHFRDFGHDQFVFRFGNYGGLISKFRPLPRFKADHFHGPGFKLHRLRPYAPWHHRGFGKPWHAHHRKTPNR